MNMDYETMRITRAITEHPELILQEYARRSLEAFAKHINPKMEWTEFHRNYYRILDAFAKGKIKRLIVQVAPQSGKSEGSSRLLPAYMLGRNPDLKIGIGSYAATIAKDFNKDVQRIIDSPEYKELYKDTRLDGSVESEQSFARNTEVFEIVGRKGSLRAVGRGGALTSKTIDVQILDDLYKDAAEANSPIIREGTWNWFTKVVLSRLHNDSQLLIVFTRWHADDVIGRIIEREKVLTITKWSDLEKADEYDWLLVNFEGLKTGEPTEIDSRKEGEALWENKHSRASLLKVKELDPVGFECLYQGNPGNAEGKLYQPFKTWINKEDWGTLIRKGCCIDVADEGDDNTCAVTYDIYKSSETSWNERKKRFEPILFALVTDIVYTSDNTDVTLITASRMINEQGTQKVWVESNAGGSIYEKKLKTKVRALTFPFYQGANKESRIITNAPFVNQSIIMPFGWETRYPEACKHIKDFLRNFSANKHDDLEDCLTTLYEKEIADGNAAPYGNGNRGVTIR